MKFKTLSIIACIGLSFLSWPVAAIAGTSRIIATYYQNGQILVDDHQAEFEVVSNSPGSPMLGETIRIIRWSNGTITTINVLEDAVYMGGYPATTYGVGFVGGRVYEAYCAENTVGEKVCYKFI
ncbi:MAG: hypothetical protein WA947_06585 [Phormidesmis sp.]